VRWKTHKVQKLYIIIYIYIEAEFLLRESLNSGHVA